MIRYIKRSGGFKITVWAQRAAKARQEVFHEGDYRDTPMRQGAGRWMAAGEEAWLKETGSHTCAPDETVCSNTIAALKDAVKCGAVGFAAITKVEARWWCWEHHVRAIITNGRTEFGQ